MFFVILITAMVASAAEFVVDTTPVKRVYVLGEPVLVDGAVHYVGSAPRQVSSFSKFSVETNGCDGPPPEIELEGDTVPDSWKIGQTIIAGWTKAKEEDLTWCFTKPRKAKVRFVFHSVSPTGVTIPKAIWQGSQPSEWKDIEIVEPQGVDKAALLATLGDRPTSFNLAFWLSNFSSRILNEFPASTYAPYAFARMFGLTRHPTLQLDLAENRIILEHILQGRMDLNELVTKIDANGAMKSSDGKAIQITRREWLQTNIRWAQEICAPHPELYICDRIAFEVVAREYLELLQFDQATAVLKRIEKGAENPILRENANQMLTIVHDAQLKGLQ